ncbi:PREDICTED: uncharacterized protein LOC104816833 [Tarenaya hassleriana]|uniref:uncharacterized protein LOC104816833 n=1 Tax=Tarenaya hassleriana TaxID=28532 RepID=UPI00053C2BAF|nr:PREDICTED: uncharacterized protein LOC104816833 [Tarenaya hassleriana]XP_010544142.1 PREDICTED: uncharacterized protein LOC104816833 [Tarenaya hassleriana]
MFLRICRTLVPRYRQEPSNVCGLESICSISILFFHSTRKSKPNVALSEYLINQHGFSPEVARKASSLKIFLTKPERTDSVLSYLKETGFSKTQIERIVYRYPRVLFSDIENLVKPKIKVFQELGFPRSDFVSVISADPWILGRSSDNQILPSLTVLKNVLGSLPLVSKVVKMCGNLLKYDLEKTLVPNIELLKNCAVDYEQIVNYVLNFPRFFLFSPENIKGFIKRVDEMGFDKSSRMYIVAIVVMSSMTEKKWELKLKVFKDLGFTDEDIRSAFRKMPQSFALSENKIREVADILLGLDDVDVPYIVNHIELLLGSVEKRLKPRLEVLAVLESKHLLKKKHALCTVLKASNDAFLKRYVDPYLAELADTSLVKNSFCDVKGVANSIKSTP